MTTILALDPADRMGWAFGEAGSIPVSGAVQLRRTNDPVALGAANLACFLRDLIAKYDKPDIIAPERYMEIPAQRSNDAAVSQLLKHGAVYGIIGIIGARLESPTVAAVRKHFCGKASAAPRRMRPRTQREREDDRRATNTMVLNRAIITGYLKPDSTDFDRANACAVHDYVSVVVARKPPRELHFFGQRTADDDINKKEIIIPF